MPTVHYVKKARKGYPKEGIETGSGYYWWKFNYGPKIRSKTKPRRSQLTRSEFLGWYYDLQDEIESMMDQSVDELEASVDGIIDQINEQIDELQDRLDNMPDHLRDSSESGQTLQERIDGLEEWRTDLESIDWELYKDPLNFADDYSEEEDIDMEQMEMNAQAECYDAILDSDPGLS